MENSHNDVSHTEAAVTNLTVEAVEESLLSIDKIELQQFQDKITADGERKTYEISSSESGTYRFEFSNVPDNIYFKMFLYNADMEQLSYNDYLDNGDGITFDLNGDTKYYVVVEQQGNVGSYTLNVGSQKATKDISNITTVSDSIQFTNQRNVYSYTSEKSGTYRFEFSNIPDNVYFKMFLYNADMEQFEFGDYLDNGDGITCDLIGSEQYYVVVEQQGYSGRYDMKIGPYIEN